MTASWNSFRGAQRPRGQVLGPNRLLWRHERQAATAAWTAARQASHAPEPRARAGLNLGRLNIDADGVFAFLLFVPMLMSNRLGILAPAMIAGLTPLYLYARRKQLIRVMLPRAFLFIVPAFALFSTVWSQAPKETLKYAIEFSLTVTAGLLLSSARSQEAVLRGMAAAFFLYVLESVLVGTTSVIGVGAGGMALTGLADSKNLLADVASTGLIMALATAFMAIRSRSWLWLLFALGAVALEGYAMIAARSAGAVLALSMGVFSLLALTILLAANKAVRAWLTSTVAVILLAAALNFRWLAELLIQFGTSAFDKDPTLTGRTYLWYRAADLIHSAPMFGCGYFAFWVQGNIEAEGLWRYAGIDSRDGFNFHNSLVEILVTLGWVGAIVVILTALVGIVALIRKFVVRPDLALVFWISILLYELTRTPIESLGLIPFYYSTAIVFAALSAGFGLVRPARLAPRRLLRRIQPVKARLGPSGDAKLAGRPSLRIMRYPSKESR